MLHLKLMKEAEMSKTIRYVEEKKLYPYFIMADIVGIVIAMYHGTLFFRKHRHTVKGKTVCDINVFTGAWTLVLDNVSINAT